MIAAIRKAGRRRKHRTGVLGNVVLEVRERQRRLGAGAVRLGWVKAHVGIPSNERADALANKGAEKRTSDY